MAKPFDPYDDTQDPISFAITDEAHQKAYGELRAEWMLTRDPFMLLAEVKTHLANHKPLSNGDAEAWRLVDLCQRIVGFDQRHEQGSVR